MDNRVKQLRDERGWKQAELAEKIGVTWQTISRIENAHTRIMPKHERNLAEVFGVAAQALYSEGLVEEREEDVQTLDVPVLARISAGTFRDHDGVRAAEIERHIKVSHLPRGEWFALTVEGDSMNRIAPDGAVIIVNRADDKLVDGEYYVFALDDGAATFKRFRRDPEPMLVPWSFNPDHYALPVGTRDLYVFGRVRKIIYDL